MENAAAPDVEDHLWTIAMARLIFAPDMNIQAPPNLSPGALGRMIAAGINDWGGVSPLTPDFINPERPWPHLAQLQARTRAKGFELKQRLPVYPEFLPKLLRHGAPGVLAQPAAGSHHIEESGSALLKSRLTAIADAQGYARSAT